MASDDSWTEQLEFVDPELKPYLYDSGRSPGRVQVLMRPRVDRSELENTLHTMGVGGVSTDQIASQSLRAELRMETLEELISTDQLEAVELERPLRVFDSGN
jgi:hypothetical protein